MDDNNKFENDYDDDIDDEFWDEPNEQGGYWYRNSKDDKIWWHDLGTDALQPDVFSFDKKKKYNPYSDYPQNLTKDQKEIFDKENPFWAGAFGNQE